MKHDLPTFNTTLPLDGHSQFRTMADDEHTMKDELLEISERGLIINMRAQDVCVIIISHGIQGRPLKLIGSKQMD